MLTRKAPDSFVERFRYPLGACFLVGIFLSFIYNRYLPVQEGWFANYGDLMRSGRMPYRDFYCFIQPIPLLQSRAIIGLGDHLIYFRIYGCIERIALTLALYGMLRQQFSRFASLVGTVVSVVIMTSSADDGLFSYFVTCLLFSIMAMGALARALSTDRGAWFIWSGVFLGLAFFTKQSSGGLLGIAYFLLLIWVASDWRVLLRRMIKVGAGFFIVGLVFALGLFALGLMGDYMHDVYFNAVAQKGGASTILTGFWSRLNLPPYLLAVGIAAAMFLLFRAAGWLRRADTVRGSTVLYSTLILFLAALTIPVTFNATVVPWFIATRVYVSLLFLIPLTFYATLALLGYLLFQRRRLLQALPGYSPALLVLVAGSMAGLYASGMSYQVTAGALAPALGVCLAYALDFLAGGAGATVALVTLSAFLVFAGATKKYLSSYWWYAWEDTSLHPSGHSRLPELAGYNLNPEEIAIYEKVVEIVSREAGPSDTVFSFPNCPLFNYLTRHPQPTFAPVHFPDVCPDLVERRDAATLRQNPPRILILLRAGPADEALLETSFRGGRPNGYHEMESTLQALIDSGDYSRVFRGQYNDESFPLEVWLRK